MCPSFMCSGKEYDRRIQEALSYVKSVCGSWWDEMTSDDRMDFLLRYWRNSVYFSK